MFAILTVIFVKTTSSIYGYNNYIITEVCWVHSGAVQEIGKMTTQDIRPTNSHSLLAQEAIKLTLSLCLWV